MNLDSLSALMPIPNLLDAKKVLCIQPHPDDIDVASGGTVARLALQGADITYLTVTDGSAGSTTATDEKKLAATRRAEQTRAGDILGVKNYIWLDYPDKDYIHLDALQSDLISAIRSLQPDTVITVDPWLPYEAHPAHRNVGLAAAAAVLFSGMGNIDAQAQAEPYSVQAIAFGFTSKPNTIIDVADVWDKKVAAVQAHYSQFPETIWPFYSQYLSAKAKQYGSSVQTSEGEALKVFTPMHLHCNVDAADM
ncbi:PIG-L deacetylase family protein [Alicyclobacillus sp. SO9]|uniref:PIG-L deacetylase family protein n=1 Tax=Alicyclobacillus sp. SO9 TaxID=2665646 RepID=UPI0018E7D5CA|nr:PIG-L deacetylase family protein [Alicyclobacillus sp. SO9]QQE77480.1 PIG-L family deacetylase [Alicyclobacillus sp. SO9]